MIIFGSYRLANIATMILNTRIGTESGFNMRWLSTRIRTLVTHHNDDLPPI